VCYTYETKYRMVSAQEILQKSFENYEEEPELPEDSSTLYTRCGATGPLTEKLCRVFPPASRKVFRRVVANGDELNGRLQGFWFDVQREFEHTTKELIDRVHELARDTPEAILEALGSSRGEYINEEEDAMKSRFFSMLKTTQTKKDYARRMAQFLRLMVSLLDSRRREQCNVVLNAEFLQAIESFHSGPRSVNDVVLLVLTFLKTPQEFFSLYNSSIFCLLPIAHLISDTNNFTCSDSAQKTISSLKFLCRGCILLELHTMHQGNSDRFPSLLGLLESSKGSNRPFAELMRLHKGVNCIKRPVMKRVIFTLDGRVLVDGIDFSPTRLSDALVDSYRVSKRKVNALLLGYQPSNITTPPALDQGETPFSAFGRASADANGENYFLEYVTSQDCLARRFFTLKNGKIKLVAAKRYLNDCLSLEKSVLPLMHLLMGSSSRGTDFEQLTFRTGAGRDLPRRVAIFDQDLILVERHNRKGEWLKGNQDIRPALLPRKWFEHVLQYWLVIRPFCCLLVRLLNRSRSELERWQRYCFVQSSSNFVTETVQAALPGEGTHFQRLRHASQAIFRKYVAPQEHSLQNSFEYDRLFGHTYRTGLCYGVQQLFGSDVAHAAADISSIARCLKGWWNVLSLENRIQHASVIAEASGGGEDGPSSLHSGSETSEDEENNEVAEGSEFADSLEFERTSIAEGVTDGETGRSQEETR